MRVLHDWDEPHRSGKRAIYRGIKLILYGIFKWFMFKPKFLNDLYGENRRNLDIIIKLDKLVGVNSVVGIRDKICRYYPEIFKELKKYGIDVRQHIHIGTDKCPLRKRKWVPELVQPRNTWHFDRDYVEGVEPKLMSDELSIWHVDYPEFLSYYIEFLYGKLINDK